MKPNLDSQIETRLIEVSRGLARSRTGQAFVAFLVLLVCLCLSDIIWKHRDFAAIILIAILADYGVKIAWRTLPIHPSTRTRWSREQQIAKKCPAHDFRRYLLIGISILLAQLYFRGLDTAFTIFDFIIPIACFVIGLGSHILCYRFIRREENRNSVGS